MKSSPIRSKQKLSPAAAKRKAARDLAYAKTPARRAKKAQNQRDELRQWIQFTLGPSAWDELIRTERDIRKQRQETIYAQQEMKQKVIEWTAIIVLIVVVLGFVFWIAWLYRRNKGYAEIKLPEFLPDPTSLLSSCCQFFGMIII